MESPKLTFSAFDAKIHTLAERPSDKSIFPKKALWGYFAASVGAPIALLSVKLLPDHAIYALVNARKMAAVIF